MTEGTGHKLLRIKCIYVLDLLWHLLLFLEICHVIDSELALVSWGATLTHRDVLFAFGERNMGYCLRII